MAHLPRDGGAKNNTHGTSTITANNNNHNNNNDNNDDDDDDDGGNDNDNDKTTKSTFLHPEKPIREELRDGETVFVVLTNKM